MQRPNRRQVISAIAGGTVAGTGVFTLSGTSQATGISVDEYSVADKEATVRNPVNGLTITVTGEFTYTSTKLPTRVVLRLEAKTPTADEWEQVTAMSWRENLKKELTKQFELSGNLLDVSGITAPDLSPNEVGETVSQEIDTRIKLEVLDASTTLEEYTVTDTTLIEVTKGAAKVTVNLNATGSLNVTS